VRRTENPPKPRAGAAEIDDLLAEKVFKECEDILGGRWWR
jgi:hypothetical protein